MNRRQFLHRGAMAAVAVTVAPVAVLAPKWHSGGIVRGSQYAMLHTGESILPRAKAEALGKMLQGETYGRTIPMVHGRTISPQLAAWAANLRESRRA